MEANKIYTQQLYRLAAIRDWQSFDSSKQYINFVFPTSETVKSKEEFKSLYQNPEFRKNLKLNFKFMLLFMGCVYIDNNILISSVDRFTDYLVFGGYNQINHKRLTQMLSSLKEFNEDKKFNALKEFLLYVSNKYKHLIPDLTKAIWASME